MGTICPCCEHDRHATWGYPCILALTSAGLSRKACDHSTSSFGSGKSIMSRQVWPGHLNLTRHRILWTLVRCESTKTFTRWSLVSRAGDLNLVVVGFGKNTAGQWPTINSSRAVLMAVSEPSLLLMDFLLTMRETTMNATYFGGRTELNVLNLIEHLVVSRGAIPAWLSTTEWHVRCLLFSYVRRQTDHPVSGILMVG
jgi:hypothetical protein